MRRRQVWVNVIGVAVCVVTYVVTSGSLEFLLHPLRPVTLKDIHCEVSMPGQPREAIEIHEAVKIHRYESDRRWGAIAYGVTHIELPEGMEGILDRFSYYSEELPRQLAEKNKGRVVRIDPVGLSGYRPSEAMYAGSEAMLEWPDGEGRLRSYLIGHRLYQIGIFTHRGAKLPKDTRAFFDSFHLRPSN